MMHLFFAIFAAAIPCDEPKIDQVVCDRYFFSSANQLYCVYEREDQNPLVRFFEIDKGKFVEVIRFAASHGNIEEISDDGKSIYCMYGNGVVERRRVDAPDIAISWLKLESRHGRVQGRLFPSYASEGSLIIRSTRDFNGPGSDFSSYITRASFSDGEASLAWEIKGAFSFLGQYEDTNGFFLLDERGGSRSLQKRDFTTGKLINQLGCGQKWPTRLRDGTFVLSGGGSYEFWDFDNRILKRSVLIPDSSFHRDFISVSSRDNHLEFVDLSGNPIPKYSKIKTGKNEVVFSIRDERVFLRNHHSGSLRIVDMVSNEQISECQNAHDVQLMPEGHVFLTETVDKSGNPVEPPGGCEPGPSPRYRLRILQKNPLGREPDGTSKPELPSLDKGAR